MTPVGTRIREARSVLQRMSLLNSVIYIYFLFTLSINCKAAGGENTERHQRVDIVLK